MCQCENSCLTDTEIDLIGYTDVRLEIFIPLEEALILRDCISEDSPRLGRYDTASGEIIHELCPKKVNDHPDRQRLHVFNDLAGGVCRRHNQTTSGDHTESSIYLSAHYVNQPAKNGDIVRLGKITVYVKTVMLDFHNFLQREHLLSPPDDDAPLDIRNLKLVDVLT